MQEEAADSAAATPLETPASIRGSVSLEDYYEIDRISRDLVDRYQRKSEETGHQDMFRVALQFPDELLDDSPEVCWLLEERLTETIASSVTPLVFCLGDTTVGSCCPDEVAALHLQAEVMVHYGHACLSPTGTLPVIYSFGRLDMDVAKDADHISKAENPIPPKFLVLYQVGYHHAMETLQLALTDAGVEDVLVGRLPQPTMEGRREPSLDQSCCDNANNANGVCCGGARAAETRSSPVTQGEGNQNEDQIVVRRPLVVGGLELPERIKSWDAVSDYTILFIGESESTSKRQYVNIMLHFLSLPTPPKAYWTFSPRAQKLSTSIPAALQKQLNRRFFLTQKARNANVLGILVSNLSQQHLVDVVKTLKARIQDAGKSSYSFAVGKINPAKLANFAEIECFVIVACREHSLLDDEREYPVPVVTPLELDVALGNLEWGAQAYTLDCQDVLEFVPSESNEKLKGSEGGGDDEDAPYFSLVTGKYMQTSSSTATKDLDLEHLPGRGQVAAYNSEAANFLKQREYQGLTSSAGQTEAKAATVGQRGIASDYGGS